MEELIPLCTSAVLSLFQKIYLLKSLLLFAFIMPVICFGKKDYCKRIKRSVDKNKGSITWYSPDLKYLSVIRQFNANAIFALHLHFKTTDQHFETSGALIQFEDGTIIKDESVKVDCKQEMSVILGGGSNSSTAQSGEYLLQGFFLITGENIEKFESQKIIKIQLHDATQKIGGKDAVKIMNYVKCMRELKQ